MAKVKGKVVQVIGSVVDIEFPTEELPAIFNAVEIHSVITSRKAFTLIKIDLANDDYHKPNNELVD